MKKYTEFVIEANGDYYDYIARYYDDNIVTDTLEGKAKTNAEAEKACIAWCEKKKGGK